ncbi:hypothetical protein I9W82_000346 [Candida metapsilosis]|uniref:Membrane anchor Opy2 N-terminal domain-containing protein n=1 Tax=Candida metapsilosis TaxID=273372 RepID=A0A8H7ZJD8_9ASCO|nr:hypothetical protein I9W82_000346 [Candida metapsilosis]
MTVTRSYIFDHVDIVQRDSDGCVTNCPALGKCECSNSNEECVQVAQTCSKCAYNQCQAITVAPKTNTGAIVGGVIGGVVLIALLAGLYYYFRVYKKKPPVVLDDDEYDYSYQDDDTDGFVSDKGGGYAMSSLTSQGANNSQSNLSDQLSPTESHFSGAAKLESNLNHSGASPIHGQFGNKDATTGGQTGAHSGHNGAVAGSAAPIRPPARRVLSGEARAKAKRRISSYESFTRPNALKSKTKQQQQLAAQQRRARQQKIIKQANLQQRQQQQLAEGGANQIYSNHSHRSSVATSISNASNILPIAYIPGVTVRPTRNNTGSLYSYDSESLFSDLNTIENASIVGENVVGIHGSAAGMSSPSGGTGNDGGGGATNPSSATMTAIKAQPKLVNVDKIEEEDEDEDEDDDEGEGEGDGEAREDMTEEDARAFAIIPHHGFGTLASRDTDDSDVDSDIGQITRATSTKRVNNKNLSRSDVDGTTMRNSNHTSSSLSHTREILMDSGSSSNVSHFPVEVVQYNDIDSNRDAASTVGSFLFDIGFDENSASSPSNAGYDESGRNASPFDDHNV